MRPSDWDEVRRIYAEGIATGNATMETAPPPWESWDRAHRPDCRLVARDGERMLGWAALSRVSERCAYGGVAEVSVYVVAGRARPRRRPALARGARARVGGGGHLDAAGRHLSGERRLALDPPALRVPRRRRAREARQARSPPGATWRCSNGAASASVRSISLQIKRIACSLDLRLFYAYTASPVPDKRNRPSGNPPAMPPSRNLGVGNASCGGHADPLALIVSAGARKEKLRQREFAPAPPRRSRSPTPSCARPRRSRSSTARRCPRTSSKRPRGASSPPSRSWTATASTARRGSTRRRRRRGCGRWWGRRSTISSRTVGARGLVARAPKSRRRESASTGRPSGGREAGRRRSHAPRREPHRLQEPLPARHARRAREAEGRDERHAGSRSPRTRRGCTC